MNACVTVDNGICGFVSTVRASCDDEQNVTLQVTSACAKVEAYAGRLAEHGPIDAYAELGAGRSGIIMSVAGNGPKGLCTSCAMPCGTFRAMQVAAGLALPKDVSLQIAAC